MQRGDLYQPADYGFIRPEGYLHSTPVAYNPMSERRSRNYKAIAQYQRDSESYHFQPSYRNSSYSSSVFQQDGQSQCYLSSKSIYNKQYQNELCLMSHYHDTSIVCERCSEKATSRPYRQEINEYVYNSVVQFNQSPDRMKSSRFVPHLPNVGKYRESLPSKDNRALINTNFDFDRSEYYSEGYSSPYKGNESAFDSTFDHNTSSSNDDRNELSTSSSTISTINTVNTVNTVSTATKSSKKHHHQLINLQAIRDGVDTRQILMIRNVPNSLSQEQFFNILNQYVPNRIEFLYLPVDRNTNCNLGYGYVSLIDTNSVLLIYEGMQNKKWLFSSSKKRCDIVYARIQGHRDFVSLCKRWKVMNEDKQYHPYFFRKNEIAVDGKMVIQMERIEE